MFHQDNLCSTSHIGVSKNSGTPKSSILIGFSIINHPFWGTPHPYFRHKRHESPSHESCFCLNDLFDSTRTESIASWWFQPKPPKSKSNWYNLESETPAPGCGIVATTKLMAYIFSTSDPCKLGGSLYNSSFPTSSGTSTIQIWYFFPSTAFIWDKHIEKGTSKYLWFSISGFNPRETNWKNDGATK